MEGLVRSRGRFQANLWAGFRVVFYYTSRAGDPKVSMIPILNQWVEEGKPVKTHELQRFVKQLRRFRRYKHSLEVCISLAFASVMSLCCVLLQLEVLKYPVYTKKGLFFREDYSSFCNFFFLWFLDLVVFFLPPNFKYVSRNAVKKVGILLIVRFLVDVVTLVCIFTFTDCSDW